MFVGEELITFINKIINGSDGSNNEEIEKNLTQFRNYLELTQMCDGPTLLRIDNILDCLEYILALKDKLGVVDVATIVPNDVEKNKTLKKTKKPSVPNKSARKHYKHYVRGSSNDSDVGSSGCGSSKPKFSSSCDCSTPSFSSSCGSSKPVFSSSCGCSSPSYSDSCGGGGSYRSC